jgi:hypothetical protein
MDDASRYVVALEARHTEREIDMIRMLADALRKHPRPDALYLDNGSTYRGEALSVACSRMEVGLIHAKPYDPQARGKMERFWRTLRERCLDHLSGCASLHDVNVRLWAFLDSYYHRREHASLIGRTPRQVWTSWWNDHDPVEVDEEKLREALTVRKRRRVRNDSTLGHAGGDWEVDGVFLSSSLVTVAPRGHFFASTARSGRTLPARRPAEAVDRARKPTHRSASGRPEAKRVASPTQTHRDAQDHGLRSGYHAARPDGRA